MKIIGIAGVARSGKDTFCGIANEILSKNGIKSKTYSFANVLKEEISSFLKEKCKVDVWTTDSEIKKDIRDFLVWYGTTFWRKRDPNKWIRNVDSAIKMNGNTYDVSLISDVRYPNEGEWINSWGGTLIHISAYYKGKNFSEVNSKEYLSGANDQEKINDPLVKLQSHYQLEWELKNLSPKEAIECNEFKVEVLKALNSSHLFSEMLYI